MKSIILHQDLVVVRWNAPSGISLDLREDVKDWLFGHVGLQTTLQIPLDSLQGVDFNWRVQFYRGIQRVDSRKRGIQWVDSLIIFQHTRDALLFKLTWGGV